MLGAALKHIVSPCVKLKELWSQPNPGVHDVAPRPIAGSADVVFDSSWTSAEQLFQTSNIRADKSAKMLARTSAARIPATLSRRGFHTTRAQFASPYHYPEGPRSNLPFNPLTKFFFLRFWGFAAVGFGLPFGIAVWQTYKN